MVYIVLVSIFLLLIYGIVFLRYYFTWLRHNTYIPSGDSKNYPPVSVVIAVKNEEKHLDALVKSLSAQDYPADKTEFIFVNDHSLDNTAGRINTLGSGLPGFKLFHLPEGETGKKRALFKGVSEATAGLIVTTDADCTHPPAWLSLICDFYQSNQARLISAPVRISPASTFLQRFQALEFASLNGTGAASFLAGSPVMCSGANLAFEKELFLEAYPHLYKTLPTGDDMFLMLFTKKRYPGQSGFLKHPGALVNTLPVNGPGNLIRQRTRWASKSSYYRDPGLIFLSALVLVAAIWPVFLLTAGIFRAQEWIILACFIFLKSVLDFIFLERITFFYRQRNLLQLFIPSQLLYPFFILVTGVGGIIKSRFYRSVD